MGSVLSLFSEVRPIPPQYQVFINFRGETMRAGFVGFLVEALKREKVNVFIDEEEVRGRALANLFTRIHQSKVAVIIFTNDYTESAWCLNELVKVKECIDQGTLQAIPVFFNIKTDDVKNLEGDFGKFFKKQKHWYRHRTQTTQEWEEALYLISRNFGICSWNYRSRHQLVNAIVFGVKKALEDISERQNPIKEEKSKHLIKEEVIKKIVSYLVVFFLLKIVLGPYLLILAIILTLFMSHLKIKEAMLSK